MGKIILIIPYWKQYQSKSDKNKHLELNSLLIIRVYNKDPYKIFINKWRTIMASNMFDSMKSGLMSTRNLFAEQLLSGEEKLYFKAANQIAEVLNLTLPLFSKDALNQKIGNKMQDTLAYSKGTIACLKEFKDIFLQEGKFDSVQAAFKIRHLISDGKATQQEVTKAFNTTIGCINTVFTQHKEKLNEHELIIMNGFSGMRTYIDDMDKAPSEETLNKTITIGGGFDYAETEFKGLDDLCERMKLSIVALKSNSPAPSK